MKTKIIKTSFKRRISAVISFFMLALSVILFSACGSVPQAGLIVAGSTSVQPYAEVLAEEFMILHPDILVDIQGGGSSAGVMAAQTDTADIGMSSRSLNDEEMNLWFVEIARDGLAVIINPDNPIQDLTFNQIRDIYAATVSEWSQLGGADAKIHIIAREEGSGTRDAFEKLVMSDMRITPRAIVQDSNGAVRQLVADDPNAIGFISLGLVNETVKAVSLEGVAATRENVINGTYGLSRPFLFMVNGQPEGNAKLFMDFTLSEEGQQIMMNEGLVPSIEGTGK